MVDTCVRVKIDKINECIFDKSIGKGQENKISNLVDNLKVIQQQVNDFLTALIESERDSNKGNTQEAESDEDDDDSDEADEIDSKKCKLSN